LAVLPFSFKDEVTQVLMDKLHSHPLAKAKKSSQSAWQGLRVGGFAFKTAEGVCRSARRHLRKALQGLPPHAVDFTPMAACTSSSNLLIPNIS